jgi:hypothetical protein
MQLKREVLPAPLGADDGQERAFLDGERHAVEGAHAGEGEADVLDRQKGHESHRLRRR